MGLSSTIDPTKLVDIHVVSGYLPAQSDPSKARFAFAYHIDITCIGHQPIQLLKRHWLIQDGDQNTEEVRGDGVVGEQPIIHPNRTYRYTSGAILKTPVGLMHGSYTFITDDGHFFDAPIPAFKLICEQSVH